MSYTVQTLCVWILTQRCNVYDIHFVISCYHLNRSRCLTRRRGLHPPPPLWIRNVFAGGFGGNPPPPFFFGSEDLFFFLFVFWLERLVMYDGYTPTPCLENWPKFVLGRGKKWRNPFPPPPPRSSAFSGLAQHRSCNVTPPPPLEKNPAYATVSYNQCHPQLLLWRHNTSSVIICLGNILTNVEKIIVCCNFWSAKI